MGGRKDRRVYFAAGSAAGSRGSGWVVVASPTKGDAYLAHLGALGGVLKLSLHKSGTCRYAFTEEYGTPPTLPDRAMKKWKRRETPPPGSGLGTRVLSLYFPTDYLSTTYSPPDRPLTWIEPAQSGGVTVVELVYIRGPRERLEALFAEEGVRALVGYLKLSSGEGGLRSCGTTARGRTGTWRCRPRTAAVLCSSRRRTRTAPGAPSASRSA